MDEVYSDGIFDRNLLKNPTISDGSKTIRSGVLEIIGHYTFNELRADQEETLLKGNPRKEIILDYVIEGIFQREEYVDRITVSTFNNFASFSVSFLKGYTLQMQIEDCNKAIKDGRNPKIGKLDLSEFEI